MGGDGDARSAGVSPYSTGGGGVTFERKVAVNYLAHLLVGDNTGELGDARRVESVAFQQAPEHSVDDLVVQAARPDEQEPSLVLALAVRRKPQIVSSDESTRKLIRQFVRAVIDAPIDGPEFRVGLVVSGRQTHAEHLATLAAHAAVQMDAPGFFDLIDTPGKFPAAVRDRLTHVEQLVDRALRDLDEAEADSTVVRHRTWQVLSALEVLMPRLESPDEADWSEITNRLVPFARGTDLVGASRLRDRLVDCAAEYSPKSARIDLTRLRRDTHAALDTTVRRHERGWRVLDRLHEMALGSVRREISTLDGARRVHVDRRDSASELLEAVGDAVGVVVTGEPGVGKSALALQECTDASAEIPDSLEVLCVNLRDVPLLVMDFETALDCPLEEVFGELSAPKRILVVDGADAVAEGRETAFRHLVEAARASDVKVIAVCAVEEKQVVHDALSDGLGAPVPEFAVPLLTDAEIARIAGTFPELRDLNANPRSRELLRRLVVVDLLVRGRVSGVPLTDAEAMNEVWQGLVRRREASERGTPDARELALLQLADLELSGGDWLAVLGGIDPAALEGLRHDRLLRASVDEPFKIRPEFAHDELRRYAVARLLLAHGDPTAKLLQAEVPRWSLSAAQLACQARLAQPDTATTPMSGRFATLQSSFDELVEAGHGTRWGDVPTDALLTLADPGPALSDAWPSLRAKENAGLRRLVRLVDQRHRHKNGMVNLTTVEPVVRLLLEEETPWRVGDFAERLLREWLLAHVASRTPAGNPLRALLRERLVSTCQAADRRLAEQRESSEAAARAGQTHEPEGGLEAGCFPRVAALSYGTRRERSDLPYEITEETLLEFLALLGPDLGTDGEEILRRVRRDAPDQLAPAVDDLPTARAVACYAPGLLAELAEGYYFDDDFEDGVLRLDGFDDGIRQHRLRLIDSPWGAAWNRGPFYPLLQADFPAGVRVINRLLNHAARIRALTLTSLGGAAMAPADAMTAHRIELDITGTPQIYVGDDHVWRWYRGTGVGPDPCVSALQALERVCDERIEAGDPVNRLLAILLEDCENLAMVGLLVGILVRHVENAGSALDAFLAEPRIWELEVPRLATEGGWLAGLSDRNVEADRRDWSLRHAAGVMVMEANEDRQAELRALGEALVANARRTIETVRGQDATDADEGTNEPVEHELATVRNWAITLDRDSYRLLETPDGVYVQATPPEDLAEILQQRIGDQQLGHEAFRLLHRYATRRQAKPTDTIDRDELIADSEVAQRILANQSALIALNPWDLPTAVAAAALEAHLLRGDDLPIESLTFAVSTVLQVGEGEAWTPEHLAETAYFEQGADRSAARALPLLLLPVAAGLRSLVDGTDGRSLYERAANACVNLARVHSYEVRLHLARSLDALWTTPCADKTTCHHETGFRIATETTRDCVLGQWNPDEGRHQLATLQEPITDSLAELRADSIITSRLDAAIRSLAHAATANCCVSANALALLTALLDAQRRTLLNAEHDTVDGRGTHTLVSARALLTLAEHGDDTALYTQLDAYANRAFLLGHLLRTLSAAAEETTGRAATARRLWPNVMRHVLALHHARRAPFGSGFIGDLTRAALLPDPSPDGEYRYREVEDEPIRWWNPLALRAEVEEWLAIAEGNATCVDQLIAFLRALDPPDQAAIGLPWIARLVLADPSRVAAGPLNVSAWLVGVRAFATDAGLGAQWQQVVDALVVAGVRQLARYSE